MADDERSPDPVAPPAEPRAAEERVETRPSFLRRHWGKLTVFTVVFLPLLIFTIWAGVTLSYSYSSGERVGFVQKLSRKGWLCKTYEGEIAMVNLPGQIANLVMFAVSENYRGALPHGK